MNNISYFDSNIIDLSLINLSDTSVSNVSLFSGVSESELNSNSSTSKYASFTMTKNTSQMMYVGGIKNNYTDGGAALTPLKVEYSLDGGAYVELLPTSAGGYSSDDITTALDSEFGGTFFKQSDSSDPLKWAWITYRDAGTFAFSDIRIKNSDGVGSIYDIILTNPNTYTDSSSYQQGFLLFDSVGTNLGEINSVDYISVSSSDFLTSLKSKTSSTNWTLDSSSGFDVYTNIVDDMSSYSFLRRQAYDTSTDINITNSTTQTGTTIKIISGSDLTYNEINSELKNGKYKIENVDIYTNSISQANKVFQKNFKDRSGFKYDSNISPMITPSLKQFVIKDVPLNLLLDKSNLTLTLDQSEEVRLVFKYKKISNVELEKKSLWLHSDDSEHKIILPRTRIIDFTNPLYGSVSKNTGIKYILSKIMYSTPPKKRKQRILEETKRYKLSSNNLKDILSFFENSEYRNVS